MHFKKCKIFRRKTELRCLPRHPGDPLDIHDLLAVWQPPHVPQRPNVEGRYDPSAKGMKKWFNGYLTLPAAL